MRPAAGERDDAVLLRAVARGDEGALAALYDRHAGWLTVRLTRRCAMPDVVDHAVQDTFLAVWREGGAPPGGGGCLPWRRGCGRVHLGHWRPPSDRRDPAGQRLQMAAAVAGRRAGGGRL